MTQHRATSQALDHTYPALLLAALLVRRTRLTTLLPLAALADFLPWLGLPLPLALARAVARRDARLAASLAALGTWWLAVYRHRLLPAPMPRTPGAAGLTVITINALREARNADRIAALARAERADLIAVQELTPSKAARLGELLAADYPHRVIAPRDGFAGVGWWGRMPLRRGEEIRTPERDPLAVVAEADWRGRSIVLVTAHPMVPRLGPRAGWRLYDATERDSQVALVLRALPAGRPVVLVGDFNLADQSAAYAALTRQVRDAFAEAGRGFGHTYPLALPLCGRFVPVPGPVLRLDYIFCRGLTPLEARVLPAAGSDHLPVLARLRPD